MSTQPQQPPQASDQAIIQAYQEEVAALMQDRIRQRAAFAELRQEAQNEIDRLGQKVIGVISMVQDDENRDRIMRFLSDEPQQATESEQGAEPETEQGAEVD